MQKIGQIPNSDADENGEWTEGNPVSGALATAMKSAWFNTMQRELVNLVEGFGEELDPANDAQILEILQAAFGGKADAPLEAYKPTDTLRNSTTAPTPDPHLKIIGMEYDSFYRISGFLKISNPGTSDGTNVILIRDNGTAGISGSSSGVLDYIYDSVGNPGGSKLFTVAETSNFDNSEDVTILVNFSGLIVTGSSGDADWELSWAQSTSTVSDTVLHAGSWIRAKKIGTPE